MKPGRKPMGADKRVRLNISLHPAVLAQLREQAKAEGISVSKLVERRVSQ